MSDGAADDREISWTETMAAAGWPDPFDLDDEMEWQHEQERAAGAGTDDEGTPG